VIEGGIRTGRPIAKDEISAEIAGILECYTQRRKTAQALALRARIVLGCAAGPSNKAVAARERVTRSVSGGLQQGASSDGQVGDENLSRQSHCTHSRARLTPVAKDNNHGSSDTSSI